VSDVDGFFEVGFRHGLADDARGAMATLCLDADARDDDFIASKLWRAGYGAGATARVERMDPKFEFDPTWDRRDPKPPIRVPRLGIALTLGDAWAIYAAREGLDVSNPFEGIQHLGKSPSWEGADNTPKLPLQSLIDAVEADASAPDRPNWHTAWCSRCGFRGYALVFGDQSAWHECEALT
jgi:hypothetical protein